MPSRAITIKNRMKNISVIHFENYVGKFIRSWNMLIDSRNLFRLIRENSIETKYMDKI